ncbi:alginate export family protein [Sphingomonas sp. T9W2]|uniref:alginate export family protein n=1 Tax=Sphingomonas sp. T9W2 TaxID=3143183 RepID=UPI0031F5B91D
MIAMILAAATQAAAVPTPIPPAAAAPLEAPPKPVFKPINHDEDYSEFRPIHDANLWTRLEHLPIADDSYATVGGELRLRPELRLGERWGRGPQDDDGNFQQRTRLWGDVQVEGVFRAFVDLEHATSAGLDSVVAPIEEWRLDFNQAFVEAHHKVGDARIAIRLGRQEVGIGNQTLFDMREGANTRRSLDVLRVLGGREDGMADC